MDGMVLALQNGLGFFYDILVWGVGILAMAFSVSAYQLRHRVAILLFMIFSRFAWIAYFFLQGNLTSVIANILTALILAVFAKQDKWKWATAPVTVFAAVLLMSVSSLLSFTDWTGIFPLLGGVFAVLSSSRKSEQSLRLLALADCLAWLTNSVLHLYYVAIANDLFCTVSAAVAFIRYRKKEKKNEQPS